MSKPRMIITGGSRGIGAAIAEEFSKDFDVVTIGRSANCTFRGDLTDPEFIDRLFQEFPTTDVLINCAGVKSNDWREAAFVNFIAPAELTLRYLERMKSGHIFFLGSNAAQASGRVFEYMSRSSTLYSITKKGLASFASSVISAQVQPDVKMTLLEPEYVDTAMSQGRDSLKEALNLIDPGYIAKVIRWILEQPPEVCISSIRLTNKRKKKRDW